jgi:hypothetical protein
MNYPIAVISDEHPRPYWLRPAPGAEVMTSADFFAGPHSAVAVHVTPSDIQGAISYILGLRENDVPVLSLIELRTSKKSWKEDCSQYSEAINLLRKANIPVLAVATGFKLRRKGRRTWPTRELLEGVDEIVWEMAVGHENFFLHLADVMQDVVNRYPA